MRLETILEEIRGSRRSATADDIRKVFGDYHNVLHWLAVFLIEDEKLAEACIVDACTIAETQTPVFHEWLVHWAARATVACALQIERGRIAELAPEHERLSFREAGWIQLQSRAVRRCDTHRPTGN